MPLEVAGRDNDFTVVAQAEGLSFRQDHHEPPLVERELHSISIQGQIHGAAFGEERGQKATSCFLTSGHRRKGKGARQCGKLTSSKDLSHGSEHGFA